DPGIGEDREEGREVPAGERVDHGRRRLGRDLHDAEHRAIRALPDELGVEREPSGRAHLVGERGDLAGAGEERWDGGGHGGASRYRTASRPATGVARAQPTRDSRTTGTPPAGASVMFRRTVRAGASTASRSTVRDTRRATTSCIS